MPGIRPLVIYDKILISCFSYLLYVLGNQKEYLTIKLILF